MNILILEDEEKIWDIYKFGLGEKHKLFFCKDGLEGASKVIDDIMEGDTVDLIITDLKMPEKNGLEFINILRAFEINNTNCKKTPILIVSGYVSDEVITKVEKETLLYLLEKPITSSMVEEKVNQIFSL